MKVFIDNDIVVKLAAMDLFDEMLSTLGASVTDVYALHSAKFRLFVAKQPARGVQKYGKASHDRIVDILSRVGVAPAIHPDDIQLLSDVDGIDEGEAGLFSAVSRETDAVLLTGDKRSLRALSAAGTCSTIAVSMAGRVLCLEQIVQAIFATHGYATVLPKVSNGASQDSVLSIVFSSGDLTDESAAAAGLSSYVASLRDVTGALLKPDS